MNTALCYSLSWINKICALYIYFIEAVQQLAQCDIYVTTSLHLGYIINLGIYQFEFTFILIFSLRCTNETE